MAVKNPDVEEVKAKTEKAIEKAKSHLDSKITVTPGVGSQPEDYEFHNGLRNKKVR